MHQPLLLWGLFIAFIVAMIIIDLMVFNRKPHEVSIRESLSWTAVWVALALIFGAGLYIFMGHKQAFDYFTGYVIEYSLSVDNIFVFLLIFSYFKVADDLQHEVLFWGVFGALVFRLAFVLIGIELLQRFYWVMYIFGAFLIYTGITLALESDKTVNPEENPILKLMHKVLPVTDHYHSDHFFIKKGGNWAATPLFVVLVIIETSDIVFALDSIPAVLAVTQERFIAFSSNAFAILGLRALYFSLSSVIKMFHYLNYGLAVVLCFVGIKMVLSEIYPIPSLYALGFIILTLVISVITSILFPPKEESINQKQRQNK